MPTPISSSAPYATAQQLLARYDWRVIRDLCTDGERVPSQTDLLNFTTAPGAKVYAALQDASGKVETACFVGGRYAAADIQALTGNGAATVARLVCDLAMDYLAQRRADPSYKVAVQVQEATVFLEALANGDRIFGLQEVADAGVDEIEVETPSQVEARNMISYQAQRLLGTRSNRRPNI